MKIFLLPSGEQSGLLDVLLTLNPDHFYCIGSAFGYLEVAFFPDAPDEEAQNELPDSIKKRILVRMVVPTFDGVRDVIMIAIRSLADDSDSVPKLVGEGTLIEDVIQGFLLFFA